MRVKIGQLMGAVASLTSLSEQKMTAVTAFRVSRLLNTIQNVMKPHNDVYTKIVSKYGTLDEEQQMYKIPPEKLSEFNKEIEGLNNEEVDLGEVTLIKESDLEQCTLTPTDANGILLLVE